MEETRKSTKEPKERIKGAFEVLKEEGRIGKFRVSIVLLSCLTKEELELLFQDAVIVRAEAMVESFFIMEYVAFAPQFDCIKEGERPPTYKVILSKNDEETVIKWEKEPE